MRIVIALGGNALLRRSDPMTIRMSASSGQGSRDAIASLSGPAEGVVTHPGVIQIRRSSTARSMACPREVTPSFW